MLSSSAPEPFPAQTTTTLTGTVAPLTGVITDATLSLPVQYNVCSAAADGCTNYLMDEVDPGTATGSINSNGDITLNDSLSYTLDVTTPITAQCFSTPINMFFQSTAPYDPSSGNVTLSASNYTIPDFTSAPGGSCGLAQGSLNAGGYPFQVAGNTNNNTTLNLQGTGLPIPPPPGKSTTNTLSTSPSSPQLTGTSVTLTDTITSSGSTAADATGSVNFLANGTLVATEPVAGGTAAFTTAALPSQTNQLTAVYSGDFNYAGSVSPSIPYAIQPFPTVSLDVPTSIEMSSPTPTPFSVTIANPSSAPAWPSLYFAVNISTDQFGGISGRDATLSYQDSGGNWCPMTVSGGWQRIFQRIWITTMRNATGIVLASAGSIDNDQSPDLNQLRPEQWTWSFHGGLAFNESVLRKLCDPDYRRWLLHAGGTDYRCIGFGAAAPEWCELLPYVWRTCRSTDHDEHAKHASTRGLHLQPTTRGGGCRIRP